MKPGPVNPEIAIASFQFAQVIYKGLEVPVREEQRESSLNTERSDDYSRCLSNSDAFFTQKPVVFGTFQSHLFTKYFKELQFIQ